MAKGVAITACKRGQYSQGNSGRFLLNARNRIKEKRQLSVDFFNRQTVGWLGATCRIHFRKLGVTSKLKVPTGKAFLEANIACGKALAFVLYWIRHGSIASALRRLSSTLMEVNHNPIRECYLHKCEVPMKTWLVKLQKELASAFRNPTAKQKEAYGRFCHALSVAAIVGLVTVVHMDTHLTEFIVMRAIALGVSAVLLFIVGAALSKGE